MDDKDVLTLTVRLYDPKEKKNPKLAASWAILKVPRADLALSKPEFAAKHLLPTLDEIEQFKATK